jgi:menaquinone-dependent protoporphyrinogen IX oxidase
MMKKMFVFSGSFSIAAMVWLFADKVSFEQFGWIVCFMFAFVLMMLLGKETEMKSI